MCQSGYLCQKGVTGGTGDELCGYSTWDGWRCAANRIGNYGIAAIDNINGVDEQTSEVAVTVEQLLKC